MPTPTEIHRTVADTVIRQMETAGTDWAKSWNVPAGDQPTSMSTRKPYNGINWLLLSIARAAKGYTSGHWATFNQWRKMGACVRKGEKSTLVILYKPLEITDKETGEDKTIRLMRSFNVFNADQVDGYDPPIDDSIKWVDLPATVADDIAKRAGADVRHADKSCAFYSPAHDFINMPSQCQFDSPAGYAATLLHEITHWTGHTARLDRNIKNRRGEQDYAFEELVAELGSAMLCGSLGICSEPREDHAKYLNGWIERLKDDPQIIFKAAAKASTAAEWVLNTASEVDELAA